MQLSPYVFFYGRCEEALEFYKGVLGGTYELQRVSESSMAQQAPPEHADRVMHATFTGPGFTFMASDGQDTKAIDTETGNISLSLGADDSAAGERLFSALAQGGTVKMPFAEAFWGGKFGMLDDKFGIEWMVVSP